VNAIISGLSAARPETSALSQTHAAIDHGITWRPITGTVHISYLLAGRVIGLSKLARVVDCVAKRLSAPACAPSAKRFLAYGNARQPDADKQRVSSGHHVSSCK
jgi:hypothetical protein